MVQCESCGNAEWFEVKHFTPRLALVGGMPVPTQVLRAIVCCSCKEVLPNPNGVPSYFVRMTPLQPQVEVAVTEAVPASEAPYNPLRGPGRPRKTSA